jgi:protein TonB
VRTGYLIAASLAGHVGVFALVSEKARDLERRQTSIEVVEQQKKAEAKRLEPPPTPIEAPKVVEQRAPAPAPKAEPVVNQAPSSVMEQLPDVGGASGAGGGDGSGAGGGGGGGPRGASPGAGSGGAPAEKSLKAAPAAGTKEPELAAEIAAWKPRPRARVKPVYPDEARSAEIEGTVVVEALIDCSGRVTSARVLAALGHGLDESALTAIKKTEFDPAPRCAPGFQKTVKINYAFRLGD